MRTLVDIPDNQLEALAEICREENLPRAAVIRKAISSYITEHKRTKTIDAFGLWGERRVDGVAYQKKMRAEW